MSFAGKPIVKTVLAALILALCLAGTSEARIIQAISQAQSSGQTVTPEVLADIVSEAASSDTSAQDAAEAAAQQSANVQTATEVTRTAVQTTSSIISTRLEAISQPQLPTGAPGQGNEGAPGVPVPSKDNAALPDDSGTMLASAKSSAAAGMSAGQEENGKPGRLGLWGMGTVSWAGNNQSSTSFDGNIYTAMAGVDYRVLDVLTLGAAIGYEGTNIQTWYNEGKTTGDGFTVMPYASLALTPQFIADAAFGMTFSQYHSSWIDESTFLKRSRDYGAFRVMGAANLSYYIPVEAWLFKLTAGTILANENSSYLTGSSATSTSRQDNFFGELAAGGSVKYSFDKIAAKIGATYRYDYALKDADQDRDEVQGLAGIELTPREGVLLDVQATNSFFREHVNNTTLSATLRLEY